MRIDKYIERKKKKQITISVISDSQVLLTAKRFCPLTGAELESQKHPINDDSLRDSLVAADAQIEQLKNEQKKYNAAVDKQIDEINTGKPEVRALLEDIEAIRNK